MSCYDGKRIVPLILCGLWLKDWQSTAGSSLKQQNMLQAYVTRHASVAAQQAEGPRVAESPRTSDHVLR